MIDLDDQLTAYSEYLDDTERRVVVLRPARLDEASSRGRRNVALLAASVLTLAGAAAVIAVRASDLDPDSVVGVSEGEWTVVPDPDGVFTPPRGGGHAGPPVNGGPIASENAILLNGVASLDDGFVAVGHERQGFAQIAAIWRSGDGESWERLAHDETFGASGFSDDPSAVGPTMVDIVERRGRVVIAGSRSMFNEPLVWVTDDLESWRVAAVPFDSPHSYPTAIAAGPAGYVMVGTDDPEPGNVADAAIGWFSVDGESGEQATFEDAWGSRVSDVIAVEDGFVAAGSSGDSAAAWTSTDGTTWQRADVELTPYPGLRSTSINALAAYGGVIVGYGSATESEFGPTGGPDRRPAIWTNQQGQEWVAVAPLGDNPIVDVDGPIAATSDGFLAFGSVVMIEGVEMMVQTVELRSDDGMTWTSREVGIPSVGFRHALTYRDGTLIAVGDANGWSTFLPTSGDLSVWEGHRSSVWILRTD